MTIVQALAKMKLDRFQPETYQHGKHLTARESSDRGRAELTIRLDGEGVLFQYNANTRFIFRNQKRADGLLFCLDQPGRWSVALIELKRTVRLKEWDTIRHQWDGAWLHALAIAAVLGVDLSSTVRCILGYRCEKLASANPDPVLLKTPDGARAYREWHAKRVRLPELGDVGFELVLLDAQGLGEIVL